MGREIVGIVLVRNEDVFVEQAIRNVAGFCDRIHAVDHVSTDGTWQILRALEGEYPQLDVRRSHHAGDSHTLLEPYAGTETWVFGVDGDELYDPRGLPEMRARLLRGEFNEAWFVKGNVLHCDAVDVEGRRASGWLAPPARSVTKLFNFAAIDAWDGPVPERLHGGNPVFRPGYYWEKTRWLRDEHEWADSPFRCLHGCFLRRSSRQPATLVARHSIADRNVTPLRKRFLTRSRESEWKLTRYRQGPHVTVDADGFFPD